MRFSNPSTHLEEAEVAEGLMRRCVSHVTSRSGQRPTGWRRLSRGVLKTVFTLSGVEKLLSGVHDENSRSSGPGGGAVGQVELGRPPWWPTQTAVQGSGPCLGQMLQLRACQTRPSNLPHRPGSRGLRPGGKWPLSLAICHPQAGPPVLALTVRSPNKLDRQHPSRPSCPYGAGLAL